LIWEQQMQICDMNEAYLQLSDKKERIVLADNRLVHEGMEHISTMMTSLQQTLLQRHQVLTETMDPIDSPRIAESIRKLKTALQELYMRNTYLVMRNNEQQFRLSFMPPKMGDTINQAKREGSHYYERQRIDPHYLHPSGGEFIFVRSERTDWTIKSQIKCAVAQRLLP
jgi:hypothetical protein